MSAVIIRLIDLPTLTLQWLGVNALGLNEIQQGTLTDCALSIGDEQVILLLPAAEVLLLELDLPIKGNQQLRKALPFALEEWLSDDVDTFHTVWHRQPQPQSPGSVYVAAINKAKFNSLIIEFYAVGLQLTGVYSEVLGLSYQADKITVAIEGQKVLIRTQKWLGGGSDTEVLPFILEKCLAEHPEALPVYLENVAIDLLQPAPDTLAGTLNLLTESYQQNTKTQTPWKRWLPALMVFFITLALQQGFLLHSVWQKKDASSQLETQTQALFKQTFPEIKRIVNIKAQAEQQLIELKKQSVKKGSVFIDILYQTGEVFNANPALELKKLDFINNALLVHFMAPNVATVDEVKQQIESVGQLTVSILALESKQDHAEVDFEIKQK